MQLSFNSLRIASLPVAKSLRASALTGRGADFSPRIDEEGRFSGYASLFGVMDLGRDIVMPGAFRESLNRRGAEGVKLLYQHDPGQPLGHWQAMRENARGLYVEGQLDLDLPKARELAGLIGRRLIDGLSIGFRTEIERKDPASGVRRLDRLDLWEISLVTFPLLPQARLLDIKSTH